MNTWGADRDQADTGPRGFWVFKNRVIGRKCGMLLNLGAWASDRLGEHKNHK